MAVAKHPSVRNRRNKTNAGFRTLKPVADVKAPAWPLAPDATQAATIEQLQDRIAATSAALDVEDDRRKRYRLNKQLERDQIEAGIIAAQVEQAADHEAALWAELWEAPQAVIWAENVATVREVALYVRWMIRAEQGDTKAASEARQLSDRLGINPAALLRLRAEIEAVDAAEDRGRRRRERASSAPGPTPQADPSGAVEGVEPDDPRHGLFAV